MRGEPGKKNEQSFRCKVRGFLAVTANQFEGGGSTGMREISSGKGDPKKGGLGMSNRRITWKVKKK